ncbi:ataxin-3-like isoform X2 [Anneissia japonica]|uniref:ataxin-3-like isoform X2 n=1 Tax=Anneissia japonica TaxID=1529436 RepID=UPI001425AECE|nr:ataxin-3-like isoform X2 [Anneissia japonica]
MDDPMNSIFHEKQEGSLCAQHCLNSLLQGQYFSAVDLADIARQLDEAEREKMAEGDVTSREYQQFLQQPSSNMDDSGYFSVQVISGALTIWGLEIMPFASRDAVGATVSPEKERCFICNYKDHWLAIRKLGQQWFNLNSLLSGPELISDTYLSMFLAQLRKEGYSIFVVRGHLPDCEANSILNLVRAVQRSKPVYLTDKTQSNPKASKSTDGFSEEDLQQALEASKKYLDNPEEDKESVQHAIQTSLQNDQATNSLGASESTSTTPITPDMNDLRKKREAFFNKQQMKVSVNKSASSDSVVSGDDGKSKAPKMDEVIDEETEDAMLEAAIKLSMSNNI